MKIFYLIFLLTLSFSCKNQLGFKTSERSINSPAEIPNLLFWFDANDVLGDGSIPPNGTNINTNWVDKAGVTGINLLTGTSPTLVHDGLNGKSVVDLV